MTEIEIVETVLYRASGPTVYDAMKTFLADPNNCLVEITERRVYEDYQLADIDEVLRAEADA